MWIILIIGLLLGGCAPSRWSQPQQGYYQEEPTWADRAAAGLAGMSQGGRMAQPAYGQPDAFGPNGVWGPTWQQYNQVFQQPAPQQRTVPVQPAR